MNGFQPMTPRGDGGFLPLVPRDLGHSGVPRAASSSNRPTPAAAAMGSREAASTPAAPVVETLEQAYARGKADGAAEAQAVVSQASELAEQLGRLVAQAGAARGEALEQASEDVATLIVSLTRRVLGQSLAINPAALPGIVQEALSKLPDDEQVWIEVDPEDVERLVAALPEERAQSVRGVPGLGGGAKVRTRYASIDATVEAAIDGVQTALEQWASER